MVSRTVAVGDDVHPLRGRPLGGLRARHAKRRAVMFGTVVGMEAGTFISGYQLQAITILLADFLLAAIHVIKHTELHTWPFWSGMSEG